MSLDVYLETVAPKATETGSGIFVRENGATVELSREEWDERFPGREPVIAHSDHVYGLVFTANITHNLNQMATAAGIYKALWRPEEIGLTQASQLIPHLDKGLQLLQSTRERFEQQNPTNGWGDYDGLVSFVADYLGACQAYPFARIHVSR